MSKISFKDRLVLGYGKIRRFALFAFKPGYLKEMQKVRDGECDRCGSCCKLMFNCPYLKDCDEFGTKCAVHDRRPPNCSIFPIDNRDIKDREIINKNIKCGYRFIDQEKESHENRKTSDS